MERKLLNDKALLHKLIKKKNKALLYKQVV